NAAVAQNDEAAVMIGWQGPSSFRRERDDEASAPHLAGLGAGNILRCQRTAMGLDDLPADRQAQPGVLAERFASRPVRIEPFEDPLDIVSADAGAVIVHGEQNAGAGPRQRQFYVPLPFRHEGTCILDQVGEDLTKPQVMALNDEVL